MWTKRRHRAVFAFLRPIMRVYTRFKYGYRAQPYRLEKRPYLVLSNHQTGFDQFLIALSFKRPLYYIASDDIFSNRYSGIIEYLVAPIPKSKSARDLESIRNCYRISKEGGTICVFPEGNRTFSGVTETIDPSIAKLVRMLKLPVVFYRFSGGYGIQPRWAARVRKGRMTGRVLSVMEESEYSKLSDAELYQYICRQLYNDECNTAETYRSRALAEYMERLFYYCPGCGGMSSFRSEGDLLTCEGCGRSVRYTGHNTFEPVRPEVPGETFFRTPKEWYDAQTAWARRFDFGRYAPEEEIFGEEGVELVENVRCKRKIVMGKGRLRFFHNRIVLGESVYPFAEVTAMSVQGKNKVIFYHGGRMYQLKGKPRFNAVRVVNLFYAYKISQGENDSEFMGL